ncbi:polysaccharide biosynthesis/export family protein [Pontiella sulfatireligans]|uniref:Uncharacterized protein n=1 Tax=Pontiella sulfatireligans TaxID=2750658 RepID=A0A6C2UPW5_9BACT|nr:polysaccharide biosynthesis/export family protein [Pontiella sulfatireligans]VGO21357.1 hypothetical protein SCARR_03429 [Pontiella sulfatireligans]
MNRKVSVLFMLVSSLFLGGCVVQPLNSGDAPSSNGSAPSVASVATVDDAEAASLGAYRLKPRDPVYIRFSGIMDQQTLDLVIDENGEISLLHIAEPIQASGLTTSALEDKIERLYVDGAIYKNVSVNVTMTAKVYYVQGEVSQPGQFQLMSGTTLLQAIAGARGYTPFANQKKVTITRQGKIYTYNAKTLEKDPSKDVKINAGDVIKVWQQWY